MRFFAAALLALAGCSLKTTIKQDSRPINLDLDGKMILFGSVASRPQKIAKTFFFDERKNFKDCFQIEGYNDCYPAQFQAHLKNSLTVLGKVINPVWVAPDNYFNERLLTPPPQGGRQRFLKAALGKEAFYLSDGFTLAFCSFDLKDPLVICLRDPNVWEEAKDKINENKILTFYK